MCLMERIYDKAFVAACCLALLLSQGYVDAAGVVCLLVAMTASATVELLGRASPAARVLPLAGVVWAIAYRYALVTLPLAAYDLTLLGPGWIVALALPIARWVAEAPDGGQLLTVACVALSVLLARRTSDAAALRDKLHSLRDDLQGKVWELQLSERALEDAQASGAHAATLAERTRIAREVHDGVGHMLTRAKFQVEALRVAHADEQVSSDLSAVSVTLDEALTSMRASVHALEDRGVDLELGLRRLAESSGIPDVSVECSLDAELPAAVAQCLLAVCRESLTNASRHAHATRAAVRMTEFPGLWKLVVENDGDMPAGTPDGRQGYGGAGGGSSSGMGIRTMRARVESLGGTLAISWDDTFVVIATIAKEGRR